MNADPGNAEPCLERRLARVEERLERLERAQEDARRSEQRRRRQSFWARLALLIVAGLAYLLYLNYVATIG